MIILKEKAARHGKTKLTRGRVGVHEYDRKKLIKNVEIVIFVIVKTLMFREGFQHRVTT